MSGNNVLDEETLSNASGGVYKNQTIEDFLGKDVDGKNWFDGDADSKTRDAQLMQVGHLARQAQTLSKENAALKSENAYNARRDTDFYNEVMKI